MTKETKSLSNEQLRKALFEFQDIMERLTCPFMPFGDTAVSVASEGELKGDSLHFGIKEGEFTEQRRSMFFTLVPDAIETDGGLELVLNDVPVHVTLVKGKYDFLDNPQIRFFGVVEFLLPNPLEDYLKVQNKVK